jgi:transposase-like protein
MSTSSRGSGASGSDPSERPKRRAFTAEYKARAVTEYDAAPNGEKGALLRREGLYSSHIIEWRRALQAGDLSSSTAKRADKTRAKAAADAAELAKLRRENTRLRTELDKTREALVITGKAHALLSSLSESAD